MVVLKINLDNIKKQQDWSVTDVCRKLVAEQSDISTVECYRGDMLCYTADVAKAAKIEPTGMGFRKYQPKKQTRSSLEGSSQPRTAI